MNRRTRFRIHGVQALGMRHELGELKRLRALIATSPGVRAFHEGKSNVLPEVYHRRFEAMLGPYATLVSRSDRRPLHVGAAVSRASAVEQSGLAAV